MLVGLRLRLARLSAWEAFWFEPVPPHVYALLRILFGFLGCVSLLTVADVSLYWNPQGLVSSGLPLVKAALIRTNLGQPAGYALLSASLLTFVAVTLGYRTSVAVPLAFGVSILRVSWNSFPLSGANNVLQLGLFYLIWTDCGGVWSIDARRRRPSGPEHRTGPIAPLRLMRYQVALIYLSSGLWKLQNPFWQDGSALHFVLNQNLFARSPTGLPSWLDPLATAGTYLTLFWELAFAPMVLYSRTRRLALYLGIVLHVGMLLTLELGLFSYVMLASYVAFLDPHALARRVVRAHPPAVGTPALR